MRRFYSYALLTLLLLGFVCGIYVSTGWADSNQCYSQAASDTLATLSSNFDADSNGNAIDKLIGFLRNIGQLFVNIFCKVANFFGFQCH